MVILVMVIDIVYKLRVSYMFEGVLMDKEIGEKLGSWIDIEVKGGEKGGGS